MTLVVDRLQDDGTGNSDAVQDIIDGRAKAWANINQGGGHSLVQSLNCSSITDVSTGKSDVSITNAFASSGGYSTTFGGSESGKAIFGNKEASGSDASNIRIVAYDGNIAFEDAAEICFHTLGTLA
jgi:hypothetical protein